MFVCRYRYHLFLLFLFPAFCAMTQKERDSQLELDIQSAFIDANRELILGNYDKAEPLYANLARQYPTNDVFAYGLGQIYAAKEDYIAALNEIRRARLLDPKNVWYAIIEGDLLEKTSQYAAAASLYQLLSKENPYEESYYAQWAFYLIKDGRPLEAINVYDRMEKAIGYSQDISRKKYMIYRGMGKLKEAATVLEEVISRQPNNTEAMYTLAAFYADNGATTDARKWYQHIVDQHPGETEAQLALVQLASPESEKEEHSLGGLERIFSDAQIDLDQKIKAIIPHIQAFANTGDPALGNKLERLAAQLQVTHPGDPKVASIQGDLAYYSGDLAGAIQYYKQALVGNKTIYSLWEQTLRACNEAHYLREQLDLARQALDLFPNQPRIYFYLAESATSMHQFPEALEAIQMGRLMARKDGYLLYHLAILEGYIHASSGELEKADLSFESALRLNPGGPEALAMHSLGNSDPKEKCRLADEAAKVDSQLPIVRFARAKCAFYSSDYTQSLMLLQPLAVMNYPHPAWLELLGDTYAMKGDMNNAFLLWEKVLPTGAGSVRLNEKMSKRQYIE